VKKKLVTVAKWLLYPFFYLVCLGVFGYLAFPYERLRDRLIAEFDRTEAKHGSEAKRLEIDELSGYWITGAEVEGARLLIPPSGPEVSAAKSPLGLAAGSSGAEEGDKTPHKDTVLTLDAAHARLRLLPLLFGEVKIDFGVEAFGGEVLGTAPVGGDSGPLEVSIDALDLGKLEPVAAMIGVPLRGLVTGSLALEPQEGKFSKANGTLELTIADVSVGDGKAKIMGQLALPEAKVGDLIISAEAKDGALKITKLGASGGDIELVGEGKINVREPWDESIADLYVRFKFSDGYRDKNELTRSLLGAPGSKAPGVMDLDQKVKKSKRPDGFYGWHIFGPLKRLKFDPSTLDGPTARPGRGKGQEPVVAPVVGGKGNAGGKGALTFPLGTSQAKPLAAQPADEPPIDRTEIQRPPPNRAIDVPPPPEPTPAPEPAPEPVQRRPAPPDEDIAPGEEKPE
jgi:type II secretion system protein N